MSITKLKSFTLEWCWCITLTLQLAGRHIEPFPSSKTPSPSDKQERYSQALYITHKTHSTLARVVAIRIMGPAQPFCAGYNNLSVMMLYHSCFPQFACSVPLVFPVLLCTVIWSTFPLIHHDKH